MLIIHSCTLVPDMVLFHYHQVMENVNISDSIFIAGPPCAGKSTAGLILSSKLNLPFIDLDDRIEEIVNLRIPEIFTRFGEEKFRILESSALDALLRRGERMAVAVGGGCLLDGDNLSLICKHGIIVTLTASQPVLLERRKQQHDRRPLALTDKAFIDLIEKRRSHYDSLPNQIDTTELNPDDVVHAILKIIGIDD